MLTKAIFFFLWATAPIVNTVAQCSICGDTSFVGNPLGEFFFDFSSVPLVNSLNITCGELEISAQLGLILPAVCVALGNLDSTTIDDTCSCTPNPTCDICPGATRQVTSNTTAAPLSSATLPDGTCQEVDALGAQMLLSPTQCAESILSRLVCCEATGSEPSGGFSGLFGGQTLCFSGDNTVEVQDKGPISMENLQIGDYVQVSGREEYAQVYSFAHYDQEIIADYLQISVKGLQAPLELSHQHMVFVQKDDSTTASVPASEVKVGDMVMTTNEETSEVIRIRSTQRRGAYAPLTTTGDIVVSGVVASNYVEIISSQDLGLGSISLQSLMHAYQAPHRFICGLNFDFCKGETYTNGISNWMVTPYKAVQWLYQQNATFQVVTGRMVLAPYLATVYLMEQILMSSLFVCAMIVGYVLLGKRSFAVDSTLEKKTIAK